VEQLLSSFVLTYYVYNISIASRSPHLISSINLLYVVASAFPATLRWLNVMVVLDGVNNFLAGSDPALLD